ncbi:class I SAM-dependent methyltransferase [Paralcaligenes ginsengisoli]
MRTWLARNLLPARISAMLWGDRDKWGLKINEQDSCWKEWQTTYLEFYAANQREGIGMKVNDAGYEVMRQVDLIGKTVLEIGPGDIRHIAFWRERPAQYILADVQQAMLRKAEAKLADAGVPTRSLHIRRGEGLPLADASVDVIISFYSLEHIYPLAPYLQELKRILKPGGVLAGAIPTEGGLAWGSGRLVTSRRWFKKNTNIDPDKIICWEHPNFGDQILTELDHVFDRRHAEYWPLSWLPSLDLNLVIRYVYQKSD